MSTTFNKQIVTTCAPVTGSLNRWQRMSCVPGVVGVKT